MPLNSRQPGEIPPLSKQCALGECMANDPRMHGEYKQFRQI